MATADDVNIDTTLISKPTDRRSILSSASSGHGYNITTEYFVYNSPTIVRKIVELFSRWFSVAIHNGTLLLSSWLSYPQRSAARPVNWTCIHNNRNCTKYSMLNLLVYNSFDSFFVCEVDIPRFAIVNSFQIRAVFLPDFRRVVHKNRVGEHRPTWRFVVVQSL